MSRRPRWLRQRTGIPSLEAYSSDGTPLKPTLRHTLEFEQWHATRSGAPTKEWLGQRLFLSTSSGLDCCVLYTEPALMSDKTAWRHFEAHRQQSSSALQHHDGIVVPHDCSGRALKSSCEKLAPYPCAACDSHLMNERDEASASMSILLTWFACIGCVAHDFPNSLKLATRIYLNCAGTARSAWLMLTSLRSSLDVLVKALLVWLGSCIAFEGFQDLTQLFGTLLAHGRLGGGR